MPRIAVRKTTDVAGKMLEDDPNEKVLYKDLSYRIVQARFEVHNILGPGYPEKIHEEAMVVELGKNTVAVERQKRIEV